MQNGGMADLLFTDRRTNFDRCRYWTVDRENPKKNILDYLEEEPSGFFNARMYSPQEKNKNIIAGSFMFDEETLAITTKDDVGDIEQNDVICFREELYRVQNIQKRHIRTNNQYSDRIGFSYLIYLKR